MSDGEKKMAAMTTAKTTTPEEERKKAESDAAKAMALMRKKRPRDAFMNRKRGRKKDDQHKDNENKCHAGIHCRLGDIDVVVEGNASNGCLCSKCQQTFHFVCLYRFHDDHYCTPCYKEHVVSQCETGTLFQELFQRKETSRAQSSRTHTESDLFNHVDNYLKAVGLPMTMKQYHRWCDREKLRASKGNRQKRKRNVSFPH